MADAIGVFLAEYLLYLLAFGIAALWFFSKSLRARVYLAGINSVLARLVVVESIKRLADRPRPYEVIDVRKLIIDNETGNSFPSGHTVLFFAIAFSFYGTRLFWPLVVIAVLGSVARVFVGVHYPADVAASIAIAGLISCGTYIYWKRKTKLI